MINESRKIKVGNEKCTENLGLVAAKSRRICPNLVKVHNVVEHYLENMLLWKLRNLIAHKSIVKLMNLYHATQLGATYT